MVESKQKNQLNVKPAYLLTGEDKSTRSLKVDLVPLINGFVPEKQIRNSTIRIELPLGLVFLRSDKPMKKSNEGDKTILHFEANNIYLTPLTLVYNTNNLGLEIHKKIIPANIKPGPVEIILKITNIGSKQLNDILIEDNFDSNDFSAVGPEFTNYSGKETTEE